MLGSNQHFFIENKVSYDQANYHIDRANDLRANSLFDKKYFFGQLDE